MDQFTITQMTDILGSVQGLSFQEMRALHRQLKGLAAHGVIQPVDSVGEGKTAADLYDRKALCLARAFCALMTANLEVRAFRRFLDVHDSRGGSLQTAIAAALEGRAATVNFDILDNKRGVVGRFEHNALPFTPEQQAGVERIIANQGAIHGGVVASVTLHLNALIQPILDYLATEKH